MILTTLLSLLSLLLLASASPLRSPSEASELETAGRFRRGIAYNNPKYVPLFVDPKSQVTWAYNWGQYDGWMGTGHEFVPMLWSDNPLLTRTWEKTVEKYVNMGATPEHPTHVLGFNEPDHCHDGGACMQDVPKTVEAWRAHMEPLRKYGDRIMIGSPAVTNAEAPEGLSWMEAFLAQCVGCKIDFIAIHWYAHAYTVENFKKHIEDAHNLSGGRPIWITEFRPRGRVEEVIEFLRQVLPWLDSQPYVHRYAYHFAERGFANLINDEGTGLSRIGEFYNTYDS